MKLAELIPQFFYDLIARLIPGWLAICGFNVALDVNIIQAISTSFYANLTGIELSLYLLGISLISGFVVGHLLSPLSNLFKKIIAEPIFYSDFHILRKIVTGKAPQRGKISRLKQRFNRKTDKEAGKLDYPDKMCDFLARQLGFKNSEEARNRGTKTLDGNEGKSQDADNIRFTPTLYVWADWLRLWDGVAGARLAKIRAEYRMLSSIASSAMLVLILHSVGSVFLHNVCFDYRLFSITICVALLGLYGYAKSYKLFQQSVINHYYAAKGIGNIPKK